MTYQTVPDDFANEPFFEYPISFRDGAYRRADGLTPADVERDPCIGAVVVDHRLTSMKVFLHTRATLDAKEANDAAIAAARDRKKAEEVAYWAEKQREQDERDRAFEARRLALVGRYTVSLGSETGHCCFEATVADVDSDFHCETMNREDALLIAEALNAYAVKP
jgi:hypothetical protein